MDAVIYCEKNHTNQSTHPAQTATWDVAGTPLLIRQLEWLYENGCRRMVVEYTGSDEAFDPTILLDHAVGSCVELVLTHRPIGPQELARRAGIIESPYLALSSEVLGTGSLAALVAERPGIKGMLRPPAGFFPLVGADIFWLEGLQSFAELAMDLDGWGVVVESEQDAFTIGQRVLNHELSGIVVHGAELQPGVWAARGASIDPTANIHAPVWIGANAMICANATVGPNAIIGEHAIVSPQAIIKSAIVGKGSVVGEGLELEACAVRAEQIVDFATGTAVTMNDPLMLDSRESEPRGVPLLSRFVGLCAVVLTAPVLALFAQGRRLLGQLWEIVLGTRNWIGTTDSTSEKAAQSSLERAAQKAPPGIIAIDRIVAVTGEDRLRTLAWYAHAKSLRTDLRLIGQALFAQAA